MPAVFSTADVVVFAVVVLSVAVVATWAGRRQRSSDGFLLADRMLGWPLLAPSLALAGLTALVFLAAPLDGYYAGLRMLLPAFCLWAAVPLALFFAVPLYGHLELDSAGEYVELRFDPRARAVFTALQCAMQIVWLGGLIALPARLFGLGTAAYLPAFLLIVVLGALTTGYVFLGGMKAGAWAGAVQLLLALVAAGILLAVASASFRQGLARVWPAAQAMGRTGLVDLSADWSSTWSAWSAGPFFVLAAIYFLAADQPMLQRFFAARRQLDMHYALLSGSLLASLAISLAVLVGMALLAFYHDHAQDEIPPAWVARFAVDATGRPLGGPETVIDEDTIDELVARGVLLDPNTGQPFESSQGLVDPQGRVVIDRLATRGTRKQGGERLLRAGREQLVGRFVERRVRSGVGGLVLAGLAGAAMAAVAVGIVAMTTLVVIDFHRRFGWAEGWLARRLDKSTHDLDQADELQLARPVVLLVGAGITLVGLGLTFIADLPAFLMRWLGLFAGPMLALFLLGLFTRRATGPGGLLGVACGMLAAGYAAFAAPLARATGLQPLWPWPVELGAGWPMTVGTAAALLAGYGMSFFIGPAKARADLAGLVVGVGPLGVLRETAEPLPGLAQLEQQAKRSPRNDNPWR